MKIIDFGLTISKEFDAMKMIQYIFISSEGYTFQPDSESDVPDIENLQVIGFGKGLTSKEAFNNMLLDNKHIQESTFNEVHCYRLNSEKLENYFCIHDNEAIL